MKTPQELAALINGREYMNEITKPEEAEAKASGLVVIFGYSDENVELRGALHDEISAYEGRAFALTSAGILAKWDRHEEKNKAGAMEWFEKSRLPSVEIEAIWDKDGYSWTYKTELPHATFDIMEDGEKFCRGIVFRLSDLSQNK